MPSKPMHTAHLQAKDGIKIFYRFWQPLQPKATLIMLHGAAIHSGLYYTVLARRLYQAGYAVYAPDLRGHGRSGGPRGHLDNFEDLLSDLDILLKQVKTSNPGKVYLWGESLGGLIMLGYAARHPRRMDGLIASAPGLHLITWLPFTVRISLQNLSLWMPNMHVSAHDLIEKAVSDPKLIARAKADPLLVDQFTVSYLKEVIEAGYTISKQLNHITKPCFFQLAGKDQVVDTPVVAELFHSLGSKQKQLKIYDNLNHCLFLEQPELLFQDTLAWLEQCLKA